MTDAMERLLERLQTGWAPKTDEIDPSIPQYDMLTWGWWEYFPAGGMFVAGSDLEGPLVSTEVLWMDPFMEWALCENGFFWLYDDQESEKVRFLGG